MSSRVFHLDDWFFIPGPTEHPPDSSLDLKELVEYSPGEIAETILSFLGMILQNPGRPSWWDWLARWHLEGESIDVGMSLFETEPESWGGSPLLGRCSANHLLFLWESIREKFPAVWLHNNECEIHTPNSFRQLYCE